MKVGTVGKNAFFYALGIIALRATSLILIPLYTHFLSMSDFGILSTMLVTIQLMMYIMPVGSWDSVCKYYEDSKNPRTMSDLFGTSVVLNLSGGIVTTMLALTLFLPLFKGYIRNEDIGRYVLLACLVSLGQSLCTLMMAYYRAQHKARSYMWIGMISSVILLVLTPVFIIGLDMGILGALYAQVIAYMAVFFMVFVKLKNAFGFGFSFESLKSLASFGVPLVVSSLSTFVIQSSCIYFLGYFGGLEDTAVFSLGYKFSAILAMLIMSPFQLAFAPYFYSNSKDPELKSFLPRIFLYISFVSLVLAHVVLFFFKIFFPVIAPASYFASYTVCLLLIPGTVFLSIKVIGETILYDIKRTATAGLVSVVFALGNLLLNALLIPHFTVYGAVIASSLTMILWSVTIFKLGTNKYPFRLDLRKAALIVAILAFLTAGFFAIRDLPVPVFVAMSLVLFSFILFAFFSNLFFEAEDRRMIMNALYQFVPGHRTQ